MGEKVSQEVYTTRLQKGGALFGEMRQLLTMWQDRSGFADEVISQNLIGSPSRARLRDVVVRTFVPRFVRSQPPKLWKSLAELERCGWSETELLPIHFYAAACAEPLMWDFVIEEISDRHSRGQMSIDTGDVKRFLDGAPETKFPDGRWTPTVATKVARGLLAALRDFGVLHGANKKEISTIYLPIKTFAFLALARQILGIKGPDLLHDDTWKLFLFGPTAVERFFIEAQQEGLLEYHAAGSVIRVDFPVNTLLEYADVLSR